VDNVSQETQRQYDVERFGSAKCVCVCTGQTDGTSTVLADRANIVNEMVVGKDIFYVGTGRSAILYLFGWVRVHFCRVPMASLLRVNTKSIQSPGAPSMAALTFWP
jgi:hypothetical protein